MNRDPSRTISVIAVIMVGVGALLSSFASFLALLWNIPTVPRAFILQDPIGWALRPGAQPLALLGMLLALALLLAGTWLFVRLVARSALPGRAAAVFFGTWGAIIVAALIASTVRAPIILTVLQIPADNSDLLLSQFFQLSTVGASWGLNWGWLTAAVVALIHRSATRAALVGPVGTAPYAPAAEPPPYR